MLIHILQAELYRFLPRILSILSENPAEKRETIRTVFRNIIPISDIRASTNLPKGKPEELSAADLLVLLHEEEKMIGVSAAKEGESRKVKLKTAMIAHLNSSLLP